jgi:hypothetical protein
MILSVEEPVLGAELTAALVEALAECIAAPDDLN